MRYTTIIDISEYSFYRNENCRLLYLHLCLKAGYHDHDRDLVMVSLRQLERQLGMTLSAIRFAVAQLESAGLLTRNGNIWTVKKWIAEQPISSRPKNKKQEESIQRAALREQEREAEERRMEIERAKRENLRQQGKTQFMLYYEEMQQRAQNGDAAASAIVERRKKDYEQAKQAMGQ